MPAVVQTLIGPASVMDEPGWHRNAGAVTHAFATRELTAVAGMDQLSISPHESTAQVLRHTMETALSGLSRWGAGAALELRYVAFPQSNGPTRLRLALTAKTTSYVAPDAAETADRAIQAICAALPKIYHWEPARLEEFDTPGELVEVRRQEEVTAPQLASVPADYYYAVHRLGGDGTGWEQFSTYLAEVTSPVSVSVLLAPTALHPVEQQGIAGVATQLRFHGTPRSETNVVGFPQNIPGDAAALAFAEIWEGYLRDLREGFLVRISVKGERHIAQATAKALAAGLSASGERTVGTAALVTQRALGPANEPRALHSWMFRDFVAWGGHSLWESDSAPHSLRRLPYLFATSEAAAVALLPVPDDQGAIGFARARRTTGRRTAIHETSTVAGIELGRLTHHGSDAGVAVLPLTDVNRHVLVVGAPGSGKTTTVLSLLARLWREHQIPFLAIEPTKTEYRSLLKAPGMEALRVVSLGRDDTSPFRLNPLAPPPGVRRESHMSAVMSSFKAALPLDPPLPQLLEDALDRAYKASGWKRSTTLEEGLQPPTLRDLLQAYERGFDGGAEDYGYSGDVRSNMLAALRLRLRSLTLGSRGLLLDTVESVDFKSLLEKPVVLELDDITDRDEKALLAAFILDRIQAGARARGSTGGALRHVTVLEEAHRLLGRVPGAATETPQTAAIRSFCDAIAELRARGEGFVISSQSPSALAEAAVANTGTRILHRLESSADRDIVLSDLDASQLDREAAARLRPGEAVARWPSLDEAEILRVRTAPGIDSGAHISDADVREAMGPWSQQIRSLLPFRLCTRDVCMKGCDPNIREEGEAVAMSCTTRARRIWKDHEGKVSAMEPLAKELIEESDSEVRIAYCAAAHLAAEGAAFTIPRKDIRKHVAQTLAKAAENS